MGEGRSNNAWMTMSGCFSRLAGVLCIAVLLCAPNSRAGSVRLRDGNSVEGAVRFENANLVVKTAGGADVKVDLAAVAEVRFKDEPMSGGPGGKGDEALHGLRGEYCADMQFKDVRMVRLDPLITFEWPEGRGPDPRLPKEFSVRWTGQIEAQHSEAYTFTLRLEGGGWLWIDNRLVVGRMQGSSGTFTGIIALKAGRKYDVKLEYHGRGPMAKVRLSWQSPHQAMEFVPAGRLSPPAGTMVPKFAMISPRENEQVSISDNVLEVQAGGGEGALTSVEFFCDGKLVGQVQRPPWRLPWRDAPLGRHEIYAKATSRSGISAQTAAVAVTVVPRTEALPAPWSAVCTSRFVPRPVQHASGSFTIRSAGGEIFCEQEKFELMYQPLNGDGTILARLSEYDPGEAGGWAGIVIREHAQANKARAAFVGMAPSVGLSYAWWEETWKPFGSVEEKAVVPIWIKLVRYGNLVKAYRSADGKDWRLLAEHRINFPPNVLVGMMVACAGRQGGSASFDNVRVTRGSPELASAAKGIVLRSGSVIGGNLAGVDESSVKLWRSSETVVPRNQVARILFRPVTAEWAARIERRGSGVLLGNGDFVDGKIESIRDNEIRIESVLLGARRYNIYQHEVVAVVLHDLRPAPGAWEIRGSEGTHMRAKSISVQNGRLKAVDAGDAVVWFSSDDLAAIVGTK